MKDDKQTNVLIKDEKHTNEHVKDEKFVDELMKKALAPSEKPDELLNRRIECQLKESKTMKLIPRKRIPAAVFGAAIALVLTAGTVYAATKLLSAKDAATHMGEEKVSKLFQDPNAINLDESVVDGEYEISLLGITKGDDLSNLSLDPTLNDIKQGSTYAVVAIAKADGTPMPANTDENYGEVPFFVSPLIKGLKPWQYNIASMNGGYSEQTIDGVMYRIIQCDNIEMFANKGLYLCVSNTPFYSIDCFNYDEISGVITVNDQYDGVNVLFNLPIDPSKGDDEAAKAYIEQMENPVDDQQDGTVDDHQDGTVDDQHDGTGNDQFDEVNLITNIPGEPSTGND